MNTKTIAYQGIIGSNSHATSIEIAQKLNLGEVNMIEAVSSAGVVAALKSGEADYGVMAVHNKIAGEVIETSLALKDISHKIICEHTLPIHHCLFVKDKTTQIKTVASHIQALNQCKAYLANNYKNVPLQELVDTAIGARHLQENILPADTAVICRKNAGEYFNLHLIAKNIEDMQNNETRFVLVELSKI